MTFRPATVTTRQASIVCGYARDRFNPAARACGEEPLLKAPGKRGACLWGASQVERVAAKMGRNIDWELLHETEET